MELRNKRVLVVGLARSGRAVADRLARQGARVTVTDLRPPSSFGSTLKDLMAQNIGMELGIHRQETFLRQDLIVASPGVPFDLPQLQAARRHRAMVVPEVEAASWFFQGTLVGVTGTNGKTTTATLLGKMLEASGYSSFVAGNIGVPLISEVDLFSPESVVVAELSSFQLEAIQHFRPQVAILLNITENHLDRHRTFSAYVSAKAQIFRNQQAEDYAILNADDPVVMSLAPAIASRKLFFSLEQDLPEGVLRSRGRILYRVGHLERMLVEEREIRLRGAFNVQNVMAAAAAACILGADFKAIRDVAREFAGVEHRLEYVRSLRGVDFYNDSKATSVDAAAKGLSTFERGVRLILGGHDKGAPYVPLRPLLQGRVKSVYLIGAAAEKIASGLEGAADLHQAGNLETAVQMAFAQAIPGDVVLLSPACSSYDQFQDFEQRGRAFKEIVNRLTQTPGAAAPESPQPAFAPPGSFKNITAPAGAEHGSPAGGVPGAAPARPPAGGGDAAPTPPSDRPERRTETVKEAVTPQIAATIEPAYMYEVASEETPANEVEYRRSELNDSPLTVALGPLEADDEPLSPYEVIEGHTTESQGMEPDPKSSG